VSIASIRLVDTAGISVHITCGRKKHVRIKLKILPQGIKTEMHNINQVMQNE